MTELFYTLAETADVLGKTELEIKEMVNRGELRCFQDSGRMFFTAERVNRLKTTAKAAEKDWTVDPATGCSNSSAKFRELTTVVANLIRGDASNLLHGQAEDTARLILAQLAHLHGLAPRNCP